MMVSKKGITLIELILVVAILAILASISIPRVGLNVMGKTQVEAAAMEFGHTLRTAKSLAISNANDNAQGYKILLSPNEPYASYRLVNAKTMEAVKDSQTFPPGVICIGASELHFTILGDLAASEQQTVSFAKGQDCMVVTVWTAGGRVKVSPCDE